MIATSMPADKNRFILQTITSYGRELLGFIRKRVKNDADAEDILQDVWAQFSTVVSAEPIEQTGAWLYRVARNRIIDKQRKKSETLLDSLATDDDEEDADLGLILFSDGSTPETEYMRSLVWDSLFLALDELAVEQRDVFIWNELDHLSFNEIAEMTGQNRATLISRKRYAVLHLRKRLKLIYDEMLER